jgi:agmatinase
VKNQKITGTNRTTATRDLGHAVHWQDVLQKIRGHNQNQHPAEERSMAHGVPTLIGLPYDGGSSHLRGPALAPRLIREALACDSSNAWTEALQDLGRPGALLDDGDLPLPDSSANRALIQEGILRILDRGDRPIALGGDHSVTYPVLKALGPRHPGLTLLHVDAHPDLYQDFEGDLFSHAAPFTRIMEEGLVTRLVQVGIRTLSGHQKAQVDRFQVEVVDMRAWSAGVRPKITGPVYLSIDLDGLDPAFAPGVSHWEPGGLSTREVLALIQGLEGPLVGADVVEFNPVRDPAGITAMVCAKLVKELAGKMGQPPR